jgi:hypothetical protein
MTTCTKISICIRLILHTHDCCSILVLSTASLQYHKSQKRIVLSKLSPQKMHKQHHINTVAVYHNIISLLLRSIQRKQQHVPKNRASDFQHTCACRCSHEARGTYRENVGQVCPSATTRSSQSMKDRTHFSCYNLYRNWPDQSLPAQRVTKTTHPKACFSRVDIICLYVSRK